jgi:hypothetical protein
LLQEPVVVVTTLPWVVVPLTTGGAVFDGGAEAAAAVTYADTGQVGHELPLLHDDVNELSVVCDDVWLVHGPESRSRK